LIEQFFITAHQHN